MSEVLRDLVTRAAVWWLNRRWPPTGRMPDLAELPWVDATNIPAIVIGPGVIKPPGLLIDFEGRPDLNGPTRALAAYGSRQGC